MIHVRGESENVQSVTGTYAEGLEKVLGLGVNLKLTGLALGEVQSGNLWDVLILSLTLLFLKLEGDTTDWTTLNTLHQMGGVTSNLSQFKISPTFLVCAIA